MPSIPSSGPALDPHRIAAPQKQVRLNFSRALDDRPDGFNLRPRNDGGLSAESDDRVNTRGRQIGNQRRMLS